MHEGRAKACRGVEFDIFSKKRGENDRKWLFSELIHEKINFFFTESNLAQKV